MYLKQIKQPDGDNFSYLLADEGTKKCAVIDPFPGAAQLIEEIKVNRFKLVYIINTHDHGDHTGGNGELKKVAGTKMAIIVLHSSASRAELPVADGDRLPLGNFMLEILHTPGHTRDSICILVDNHLLTGDTLFVGKVGGTGSKDNALNQFNSLQRLMNLHDWVSVWPGHDYGGNVSSTIKEERETNPFCRRLDDFEEFYHLKKNWSEYKQKNGIT